MIINNIHYKNYFYFTILYFIANILLLLNLQGVYWDDWTIYNQSFDSKAILFNDIQFGIKGTYSLYVNDLVNSIVVNRIFIFVSYFIMAILYYNILLTIKFITVKDAFWLTMFFMLIPVNHAKLLISIAPFSLPLLLFFIAFYLLSKYLTNKIILYRILILVLFYMSFDTNSILVFYVIVLFYIFYQEFYFIWNIHNIKSFLVKYIDFVILPIIYFIIKMIYFRPTGIYEGYNMISLKGILLFPYFLMKSFYETLYLGLNNTIFALVPFILIIFLLFCKNKTLDILYSRKLLSKLIYLGISFFIVAVFAYCLIGKLPGFFYTYSRFQILTPLSFSFIIYFSLLLFVKVFNIKKVIFLTIIWTLLLSFIIQNINYQLSYIKHYIYTEAIKENIKDNEIIKNNTTFIIDYKCLNNELDNIGFMDYELNGMMKEVFNDESRLMVNNNKELHSLSNKITKRIMKLKNMTNWVEMKPIYVSITLDAHRTNERYLILLFESYFNVNLFKSEVKKMIHIKIKNINE